MIRRWSALLAVSTLVLTACGHTAPPSSTARLGDAALVAKAERPDIAPKTDLGLQKIAESAARLTPEKVEASARARATAWQADAELRFVGWGVAKFELLSTCTHIFYSPSANEVCIVTTFLQEKWQKALVYDHKLVTAPAQILQPLSAYPVNAHRALKLSKKYFSFWNKKPVSLVALTFPRELPFPFWGVVADKTVVLVHAETGQSLSPRGFDPFPKEWTK